jgi:hypothetical protein
VDTARFDGSRREEVLMWPVDEVDDGEEPPVPDFIATEARIGAHHYELHGVILSRGEGVRYLVCRKDRPSIRLRGQTPRTHPRYHRLQH